MNSNNKTVGLAALISCVVLTAILCAQPRAADAAEPTPASAPAEAGPFDRAREAAQRASCQNNLKQIGIVMKMFANEHHGAWPGLWSGGRPLMFEPALIYPEYLTDPWVLICPADKEAVSKTEGKTPTRDTFADFFKASSYWYLGYGVATEQTGLAFAAGYKKLLEAGEKPGDRLAVEQGQGAGGSDSIPALKEGIQRSLGADPWAIPVVICPPGHHELGGNVLFMDGHVEFLKYPSKFPLTEAFVKVLESIGPGK